MPGVRKAISDQWQRFAGDSLNIPFIDLEEQQKRIRPGLRKRIDAVLAHGQYILGPEVGDLETRLAEYTGVRHCISVASGTDALLLSMMALGVGAGDEIITTPFTFISTAETIILLGAIPVFVDINPHTYNMDPGKMEAAITAKTRAIMPVSLYGQCADFDAINAIAARYGLPVIEAGAQSFGAGYRGKKSCSLTTIGCTSFFPSKPLGCYGEGGACFTDNDELAVILKEIRVHGQDRRYHHKRIGINGRMDTLQAAILLEKFEIFPSEVELRQQVAGRYTRLLHDYVRVPFIEAGNTSVYAQYTIESGNRESMQEALQREGIPTAVHYPIVLSQQPALAGCGYKTGDFPDAENAASRVLSLPMHPYLDESTQDYIINAISKAVSQRSNQ